MGNEILPPLSDRQTADRTISDYTKAIGLDVMHTMVTDQRIRSVRGYGGVVYLSIVDLMAIFGEDNRKGNKRKTPFNPRRYWSDSKAALLAKDRELYDSIVQLKLPARDSKLYKTDVAPLWACLFIILLMDTPAATQFKKSVAKGTAAMVNRTIAEIKYRALNIANGMEWAADSIHLIMEDLGAPESEVEEWWDK
ncbi:MAG: hypothetical protein ACYDBJ_09735 [Aggregatilineales bacterium]